MKSPQSIIRSVRRVLGLRPDMRLDPRLAAMERVFLAPPLTPELAAAIRLISPQFPIAATEQDRAFWEADQNGACWGEYEALQPLFRALPAPARVLEIGCGMGRSLVFFAKKLGWQPGALDAYEGDGNRTRYTFQGPRFDDSFCGNIAQLRRILAFNGLDEITIHNAAQVALAELPGPYDFLYSFYSIGYHWALEHFLADLLPLLHERSVAVFTVPREFVPFAGLQPLAWRLIEWKPVWPREAHLKLLVLGKTQLPPF